MTLKLCFSMFLAEALLYGAKGELKMKDLLVYWNPSGPKANVTKFCNDYAAAIVAANTDNSAAWLNLWSTDNTDKLESIAIDRAKALFGTDHVNVQPHSGAEANFAAYLGMMKPGDTFMGLSLPRRPFNPRLENYPHGQHFQRGTVRPRPEKWSV